VDIYTLIYIASFSLLAVILTVRDKNAARKNARRIKERTLFIIAAFGGSAAMLLTMLAVRHKTQHKKFMAGIPFIIIVQAAFIVFALSSSLSVSHYEVETKKVGGEIKLMLITDLHSCDYGDGQTELITVINAESPNAIFLVGDIYDDGLPPDNATEFIQYISGAYPCYYVSGNHEFWSRQADVFKAILESYGVKVLEGTIEILEIGGERIRIGGIDDPDTNRYPSRSIPYAEQISRLSHEKTNDGLFTILLSHRPERIDDLLPLNPDIVLSGHAHGGQWRLPVLLENGLFSPNQGLFPKYTNGEYVFNDTTLFVSRGLAKESTRVIPRIFNRPELVVITLK
jgi:predicted MPP superfamily phosphohydrolase